MFKKKSFILLIVVFFITSCGDPFQSVKRGLTGQKQKSTDEFLVRKKDPLILPPNYESLPSPNERTEAQSERISIKGLVINEGSTSEEGSSSESSIEKNILKKIKKN